MTISLQMESLSLALMNKAKISHSELKLRPTPAHRRTSAPVHQPLAKTSFIFKCHRNSRVERVYYTFSMRLSVRSDRLWVRAPSVSVDNPQFFSGL